MSDIPSESIPASLVAADINEDAIFEIDAQILRTLLIDRSANKNISWAVTDYENLGEGFRAQDTITVERITGDFADLIQPRATKPILQRNGRRKSKAEVFTPSWMCNHQNNLVDNQWFASDEVFNIEHGTTWTATIDPVDFSQSGKTWREYVDQRRLEITCGEAPYIVSRYDTVSGHAIPLDQRIGLFDRKMRVINENTATSHEWNVWSFRALESVYAYEYQGDSVLLARENLLMSYVEYYVARFRQLPDIQKLRRAARIISWNVWQMDAERYVVPQSCVPVTVESETLFGPVEEESPCPGCADLSRWGAHTGIYSKVYDWRSKRSKAFHTLVKAI